MQQAGRSRVPRGSRWISKRIVRTGNITNSIVVIGDNNQLSLNNEGNAIIDRLAPSQRPSIRRHSSPVIIGRPQHKISIIDRDEEINTVQGAIQSGNSVEFYCEEGWGKTTLLRYLSSQRKMADGMVFIDRGKSLDDLLQELFEAFYYCNRIYKPTQVEYKRLFENIQALILLDNYTLTREETQVLLDTLPNCVFVFASNERHLWDQGNVIHLTGLPLNASVVLFQKMISRQLTRKEISVVQSICKTLQGHPLHIIQAATLIREQGNSLQGVARHIQSSNPSERVLEVALSDLPKGAKSLLALLATFRNAPLPAEHITGILHINKLKLLLKSVLNRGLVKAHSPRYSLTGNLDQYINKVWDLSQWNEASWRHFLHWSSYPVSKEQVLDSAEALMMTMENAANADRWQEVLQIGVAVEPGFVIGRRWGIWQRLLKLLFRAGQSVGDRFIEAWVLHQLGSCALCMGNLAEANQYLSRALEIRKAIGDKSGASATLHNLGQITGGGPPRKPPGSRGVPPSGRGWIIPLIGGVVMIAVIMFAAMSNGNGNQIPVTAPTQEDTPIYIPTEYYTSIPTTPKKVVVSYTASRTSTPSRTPSRTQTSSLTPSFTFTPSQTKTYTFTPLPPQGEIWIQGGCDQQYDAGINVQVSTQINQDGIVTILYGNEKIWDFVSLTGNKIYNFDWSVPYSYGSNNLILEYYDSQNDYWYELDTCPLTVWDSTSPTTPITYSPGSTAPPPEHLYSCPIVLNWSDSFDVNGIQYYYVILESCDFYTSNCASFREYTTQSTNQDISADLGGGGSPNYRWYVYAVDTYGNYSNSSDSRYIKSFGCP